MSLVCEATLNHCINLQFTHYNQQPDVVRSLIFCTGLPAHGAEIWFLDRSLIWSFLAPDFATYYRLMLMHLGLPQWQYAFSPVGLSPKAKVNA